MSSSQEIHYLDGKWVREEDCKISVFDITVLRGFGVFDFLRTYNKKPFLLDEHLDRLFNSAKEVGLTIPLTRNEIADMVHEGIKRSSFDEIYVKIIVTGGVSADAITPGKPSIIGLFVKAGTYPPECKTDGISVSTVQYERNLPKAKSLNYMQAVISIAEAKKKGSNDVLYISYDGEILEGTTVNFFAVKNGKLLTTDDGVLYGITRNFILKIAKEMGLEVVLTPLKMEQIKEFDEAFISSTTKEIFPVVRIDDQVIASGHPGPITTSLMNAFESAKQHL
eukprot:TRINITY_DN15226_c0_g1_i1.p1 TRINITY_DN15226_c0_g1~~TRINITY_DN15226_c0_g1_i1.p1  ORF type:complete len:280 (-),score=93.42 TRINITY_DN15226_c0_g1_i1:40-879(-)